MSLSNSDVIKVTFEVSLEDGTIAQNVYYMGCVFPGGDQTDTAVKNAVQPWIAAAYNELSAEHVSTITQNQCHIHKMAWDAGEGEWYVDRFVADFTPSVTYGNATESLPNQCAAHAQFETTRPKSFGRKFLFPWGEDRQDQGYMISAALTDLADYAAAILDDAVVDGSNVLTAGIIRVGVNTFLGFTGAVVTDLIRTQRRRVPGVGE